MQYVVGLVGQVKIWEVLLLREGDSYIFVYRMMSFRSFYNIQRENRVVYLGLEFR